MSPASVILMLAVLAPGRPPEAHAFPFSTEKDCKAARQEWMRPERGGDGLPLGAVSRLPEGAVRYAECMPLQPYGEDT